MKSFPLPHKRGPVDPGSSRRRPITWDETRGHDAPHRSLAVPVDLPPAPLFSLSLFFSGGFLALLNANPSIASDRLRPGLPCSALKGLTSAQLPVSLTMHST
ncbi:hypothetical protein J3E68DRAFT_142581 [Trichoderma sp. SZMC 28012]